MKIVSTALCPLPADGQRNIEHLTLLLCRQVTAGMGQPVWRPAERISS